MKNDELRKELSDILIVFIIQYKPKVIEEYLTDEEYHDNKIDVPTIPCFLSYMKIQNIPNIDKQYIIEYFYRESLPSLIEHYRKEVK